MKPKVFIIGFVVAIITLSHVRAFSQEFGKVSKEELSMTSIPEDPEADADAVILFDFGAITPQAFAEHKRVKVFTKRGTEFANISIPFRRGDKIKELEGYTITKNGKKFRLNPGQVFTKEGRNWNEMVFSLPGVEEGCVFEYRYMKWTNYTYVLGPWYFQNEIFTKLSQVTLKLEMGWLYSYFFKNPGSANTEPSIQYAIKETEYIWTFRNIPLIKEEPYVACINDYRTAVYFERSAYKRAYSGTPNPIDTWAECGELADTVYKAFVYDKSKINKKASELIQNATTDSVKLVKIYDYVRQNINWNGERGIFNMKEKTFGAILTRQEGSGVEKNLLLLNLLKAAGFLTYPVLINTRDFGRVIKEKPGLIQFNHLVVWVKLGEKEWLVDAVDRLCPLGMLPPKDLGRYGLLLDGERSRITEIPSPEVVSEEHYVTQGKLWDDGGIACSSSVSYQGYYNLSAREQIEEQGKETFSKQEFLHSIPTAIMDSIIFSTLDSIASHLEISFTLSVPHHAQVVGEDLYVNLTLYTRLQSNPFENESRYFPVDFPYPLTKIEDTEFSIPNGLAVRELPANVYRKIPGATFSKTFSVEGNLVKCHRQLDINQIAFPVEQYQGLRNFYQDIVSTDQLLVTLTREHK